MPNQGESWLSVSPRLQVHLGFFSTEAQAARAYDRAAINKGARDGGKIITNFELADYARELDMLHKISQDQLVAALANEQCALLSTLAWLHCSLHSCPHKTSSSAQESMIWSCSWRPPHPAQQQP